MDWSYLLQIFRQLMLLVSHQSFVPLIFPFVEQPSLQICVFSVCNGSIESEKIYCHKILTKNGVERFFCEKIIQKICSSLNSNIGQVMVKGYEFWKFFYLFHWFEFILRIEMMLLYLYFVNKICQESLSRQ